jgi:sugar/nucleoside kinase (ribokinase family)
MGSKGAALFHLIEQEGAGLCQVHHMPALPTDVVNSSGAGDCLVAGTCMRLLQGGTAFSSLAYGLASHCCHAYDLNVDQRLTPIIGVFFLFVFVYRVPAY